MAAIACMARSCSADDVRDNRRTTERITTCDP
jgi:hypothetical protein